MAVAVRLMEDVPGTVLRVLMRPSARLVAAILTLGLAAFTYATAESLPIGLLPLIGEGLRVSDSQVGLLVTAYGLVVVIASIPLTHATRRVPRRSLLTALVAVFVVATLASSVAPTYETLLGARIVTALSQALFWSIVVPAAAGLAPAEMRGRAIAVVFAGGSLAAVAGVPVGTWLGDFAGWRIAFVSLAGLGAATCLALVALLPADPPALVAETAREPRPLRPYVLMIVVTILVISGSFAAFTYVAPYLLDVAGFPLSALGPLLLVRGVAGIAGVAVGGRLADRSAVIALGISIVGQAVAFLGMAAIPEFGLAVVVFLALSGLASSAFIAALGNRLMDVAPFNVDLASAGLSTAVNVGIAGGALVGGILLPLVGVRAIVVLGAALSLAGFVFVLADRSLPALAAARAGQGPEDEVAA